MTALLMPGLAYGVNPSANLTVQVVPSQSNGSILPPGNWQLTFSDEFNGTNVDSSKWVQPPNGSIQNGGDYIDNSRSISFSNGALVMSEFPNPNGGDNGGGQISSLNSYGPGYYEARIDPGTGWSAFWTLGGNGNCVGDRTAGFEADVYENLSGGQNNVHWGGYGACHQSSGHTNLNISGFHILGMQWDASLGLTFYLDGQQTFSLAGPAGTVPTTVKFTVAALSSAQPFKIDWFRYYTAQ